MAESILVIGPSGTGKSTSIETLDPKETFIINIADKALPFRGSKSKYKTYKKDNPSGNFKILRNSIAMSRYQELKDIVDMISKERPEITNVIIDDFQYLMIDEYMSRSTEKGYDKFAEMAKNMWSTLDYIRTMRPNLTFVILSHSTVTDQSVSTIQTLGKISRDVVKPEGKFTVMLHTVVVDNKYKFLTQYRSVGGIELQAKSPRGMFDADYIDNDLKYVINKMHEYFNEDINM